MNWKRNTFDDPSVGRWVFLNLTFGRQLLSSPHYPCTFLSYFLCCPKGGRVVCYQLSLKPSKNDPNNKLVICKLVRSSDQHLNSNGHFAFFWLCGCYLRAERSLEGASCHPETVCASPSSELIQLSLPSATPALEASAEKLHPAGKVHPPLGFWSLGEIGSSCSVAHLILSRFETVSSLCPLSKPNSQLSAAQEWP